VRDSDYGIDINRKDQIVAIVKSLLKHGADPNLRIKQSKEKAAAEIKAGANAFYGKRTAVTVTEILLQGATPIVLAAETNNLEVIKMLVDAKGDPNIPTESGTTALMMSSGVGTDVQRMREPDERNTAVQTAKFLVEHGAETSRASSAGRLCTPRPGLNDVIEYLVAGCESTRRTISGRRR
jgi:ankyrin repeat protein